MSRGTTLGRYTLIEQLAVGGMAEIWLAHMAGPEGFEKLLVIKKILPHLLQRPSFLQMFLNEARLAAQLNHPNVVQIYDLGKVDEIYFIAMEYIFGRDLSEIGYKTKKKQEPIPIEFATKIISQVCEGLYAAHTKSDTFGQPLNIVHRDVSPHNVLVSFSGNVKILDFGIAKAANQYDQTQQGILKGKVSYMSPEQILGDPIDARSDLFSLGAVFYELVTGYRLFTGDNDIAILRSITEDDVEPPSTFNKEIPPDLEAIILGMLEKNPDDRYPNAFELQQDLNLLLKRLGSPTNIHMAQYLRQLFDDEMDAERRYLQRKIEDLVHAEVLPPIEEEETLVVFAGSQELDQYDIISEEDEIDDHLPIAMGQEIDNVTHNPWLDQGQYEPEPEWASDDLDLATSEVESPLVGKAGVARDISEATRPELAIDQDPPTNPAAELEQMAPLHHPSPTPTGSSVATSKEHTSEHTPPHGSRYSSPLFETIQQLQDFQGHPGGRANPSVMASSSHAEALRNASYVGPPRSVSYAPETPRIPPAAKAVPSPSGEQSRVYPSRTSSPGVPAVQDGPLFVPMSSEPRRDGDIPLVLSLSPDEYHQLAQKASQQDLSVLEMAHVMVRHALASSEPFPHNGESPCQSPPRSNRVAATSKKD
ncbi:MAG: serine/threonine protein kinase [Deltaproteobacteria bacterium]|nr:MAG: serine/threonine protein kinase [Deltaproteobacteria bacterium]